MCYREYEVTRMLEVPVYNLFVKFGEHIFQTSAATTWEQTVNVYHLSSAVRKRQNAFQLDNFHKALP
jgi:hypothetical protein